MRYIPVCFKLKGDHKMIASKQGFNTTIYLFETGKSLLLLDSTQSNDFGKSCTLGCVSTLTFSIQQNYFIACCSDDQHQSVKIKT